MSRLRDWFIIAVTGFLAAGILASCTTTPEESPGKNSAGKNIVRSPFASITRNESWVQFVGDAQPDVLSTTMRFRDQRIREEKIVLDDGMTDGRSHVYIEVVPNVFNEQAAQYIRNEDVFRKKARYFCQSAEIGEVGRERNANGDFRYISCRYALGATCVIAMQGLLRSQTHGPGEHYRGIGEFRYCSASKSEAEILDVFGTLRVRPPENRAGKG